MELNEYAKRCDETDPLVDHDVSLRFGIQGLAEHARVISSDFNRLSSGQLHGPPIQGVFEETLGELLWCLGLVAHRLRVDLNQVAEAHLEKARALWTAALPEMPRYDDHDYENEKFLRQVSVRFEEDSADGTGSYRGKGKG